MKLSQVSALAACVPAATARFVELMEADHVVLRPDEPTFLIETAPGKTQWVTEEQKWELRRDGQRFMDITATKDLGSQGLRIKESVEFPKKCVNQDEVKSLAKNLDTAPMKANLEKLSSFHTRYYNSEWGLKSSDWVLEKVNEMIKEAGADKTVTAQSFPHTWKQHSVIATIPGQTNSTIVIGAHQDSINLWLPILAAPGADDDGSGTVTIMEVFRALLKSKDVVQGKAINTIEFHWYSAEEGGLLGSQAIFQQYEKQQRDVKAMLQQDMTGYVKGTLDAGLPESVGVIVDFVHAGLTKFIKTVIEQYCAIPWVETKCGYACSDHASASKAGYPSAFVIESSFDKSDPNIHTTSDLIEHLSFDHMLQHAHMTLGFVYELGFHNFAKAVEGDGEL
ncbi:peptidase M28 family protein [Metarhizium robertsii]|uniref:Leucine aminopeptidase 1 n=2 Tax=Metarhizium robertsii TaxID=568076 RepID=LAP1_METRA|nr:EF-Hand 1, calcium-binding site [Metarhizium robertsii ARSEF 23]E9F277.1 RecName: Full=Leucine aminopeptidase 1; AltName: Full=Leucyl aminopeptidase 1; Short=LAP1; Flags: Precursor [Metarhizium robertsii ARSEF 23]EFY98166.1 EF-Hand 1, calcium-binding site [Metarhizium robertsii ARSEF 23]EXV01543.1 peptidase M28 family protein [Metarhizium robertsii]